ncbi:cobalamin biosynthesis protein [Paragemmobacter straminiformis]|uniref:Cobalamin biosynthesis protein n=1 Tax=Paragemmobacter straminiformis TaxID=2045119 RepID=A0A842I5S6_9RHOB|nr:cobalamin biosynthesis protein [Gemmobacter straminiformis]MBC2834308.1 cobalamin biosynthesis protein [Gemmobacter straminiformis]
MRVAGLGFRAAATVEDLMAALALAGKADVLATDIRKADAAVMAALAARTGLAVRAVDVSGTETPTRSARVKEAFGTGSVAEAAALRAAGAKARLVVARVVTPNGMATAAIAEGDGA